MTRSVFVTSVLSMNIIFAQNTSYKFDYYDISNGLSQNRAQALYQGKKGYIYVGSQGGLDRFDGYNFKYYSHNPSDSTSIPTGWVSAISHYENDNLYELLDGFDDKSAYALCNYGYMDENLNEPIVFEGKV